MLSKIALNLNMNKPYIAVERIKLVANAKSKYYNVNPETWHFPPENCSIPIITSFIENVQHSWQML